MKLFGCKTVAPPQKTSWEKLGIDDPEALLARVEELPTDICQLAADLFAAQMASRYTTGPRAFDNAIRIARAVAKSEEI